MSCLLTGASLCIAAWSVAKLTIHEAIELQDKFSAAIENCRKVPSQPDEIATQLLTSPLARNGGRCGIATRAAGGSPSRLTAMSERRTAYWPRITAIILIAVGDLFVLGMWTGRCDDFASGSSPNVWCNGIAA
jgi:hypothetical protein